MRISIAVISSNMFGRVFAIVCFAIFSIHPVLCEGKKYLRVAENSQAVPIRLETEIVQMVPDGSKAKIGGRELALDLIGAVHVGDLQYYQQLNQIFKSYDVVLYELIAPAGTRVDKRNGESPVSVVQVALKNLLKLEFQLDQVDYSAKNFVHADLSPDEFLDSMKHKGESFTSIFLQLLLGGYVNGRKDSDQEEAQGLQLLLATLSPNRGLVLKRVVCRQLVEMDFLVSMFVGDEGSTIISERNNKALSVFEKQVKLGKKKIAIYYGAGHLPDMESKIISRYGFKREGERWITAWNLAD